MTTERHNIILYLLIPRLLIPQLKLVELPDQHDFFG